MQHNQTPANRTQRADGARSRTSAQARAVLLFALFVPPGCSSEEQGLEPDTRNALAEPDAGAGVDQRTPAADAQAPDATELPDSATPDVGVAPTKLVVVTFNTGTNKDQNHDLPPDDGYSSNDAEASDKHYGDGLAWRQVIDDTRKFFAKVDPDIVVFQEIFYSGNCPAVPADKRKGFVCETWKPGDPTVAQLLLGNSWQVACHPGKDDKCAAVHQRVGRFRGCNTDFCLEGLAGTRIDNCGGGARVARGVIDLVGGGILTLVNIHGTSGISGDDADCRKKQVDQIFVDLGDGAPAANGPQNLIMGDLNTDPGRATLFDKSARRWNKYVGPNQAFHFISEVGPQAQPSYAGLFNIDHVISDKLNGSCWIAGLTAGHPAVTATVFFDHKPVVCELPLP